MFETIAVPFFSYFSHLFRKSGHDIYNSSTISIIDIDINHYYYFISTNVLIKESTMRTILLVLFIFFSIATLNAQTVVQSIEAAEKASIDISEIEEQYDDAMNTDPEKAVFSERESEFYDSYRQLIFDVAAHLRKNDFQFDGETRMFTRIYFNKEGAINHFFYSSGQAGFSTEQVQQFNSLLQPFLNDYQFSQVADRPFTQCSPVVYATGK